MSIANDGDFKSIVRLLFENGCNIPQAFGAPVSNSIVVSLFLLFLSVLR
jgi:hypothetical protein